MSQAVVLHLLTVLSILVFKVVLLVVGLLVVRMGYNLLRLGITGKFEFKGNFTGIKADLVSSSPGLLFLLLGVILLTVAVVKDKSFETSIRLLGGGGGISGIVEPKEVKPELPTRPPGT